MWNEHFSLPPSHGPYGQRISKSAPCSPLKPLLKKPPARVDSFHVIHKVPVGDTPYVKAKHVQLVDKDPDRAIALFWAAINAGDRVDSALKDMAIVMKQQNRPEEAIEAIKSLRSRCSDQAQESLDNVLLDLYKRCARLDDQIALLKHKLHLIHQGLAFNGKRTKTARSQGKKFQVSIEQEASRLLGNLGWAYMQQSNFVAAEAVYRKALSIEPDNNKVCNLGICLMKQGRLEEAKAMLRSVKPACADGPWGLDSHLKSYERAQEMLRELEDSNISVKKYINSVAESLPDDLEIDPWQSISCLQPSAKSLHDSSLKHFVDPAVSGALLATSGFGPLQKGSFHSRHHSFSASNFPSYSNNCNWEEDDAEQGFADENSNRKASGMNQAPAQAAETGPSQKQHMDWQAEVLRRRLENVSMAMEENKLERSQSFRLPRPSRGTEHVLNVAAPPYIARGAKKDSGAPIFKGTESKNAEEQLPLTVDRTNQGNFGSNFRAGGAMGNRMTNSKEIRNNEEVEIAGVQNSEEVRRPASRRSLSLGSFTPNLELACLEKNTMPPPPPVQSKVVKSSNVLFPVKENSRLSPAAKTVEGSNSTLASAVKEKSSDPWSSLGFIQCPDQLDFESVASVVVGTVIAEATSTSTSTAALDCGTTDQTMHIPERCQRRLRVFQEMTLSASPHA